MPLGGTKAMKVQSSASGTFGKAATHINLVSPCCCSSAHCGKVIYVWDGGQLKRKPQNTLSRRRVTYMLCHLLPIKKAQFLELTKAISVCKTGKVLTPSLAL